MDERLKNALSFANYKLAFDQSKQLLKAQYLQNCQMAHNGGQFFIDQNLICFCKTLLQENQKSVVLLDINQTPIRIDKLEEFYNAILGIYVSSSNSYSMEFEKLKKSRNIEKIIE